MTTEHMTTLQTEYPEVCNDVVCECGDGWYPLIERLAHHLTYLNLNRADYALPIQLTQIKEKYGTLRVDYVGGDKRSDEIVRFVESLSHRICESCSSMTATFRVHRGWMFTRCDACWTREGRAAGDGV